MGEQCCPYGGELVDYIDCVVPLQLCCPMLCVDRGTYL